MQLKALFVAAGLAGLASASPKPSVNKEYQITENNIKYNVFEHAATNTQLKFVNNSGLCETTPGVNQVSGYLQTGAICSPIRKNELPANIRFSSNSRPEQLLVLVF